jgi:hypothetical protein
MDSQPLFIIGSPRSGTTFLVNALNQHPSVQLTNETRIFVLLKDMIDVRSHVRWLLGKPYRDRFAAFVKRNAGHWVEQFYREELGLSAPIWGDKHPHYASPWLLTGPAAMSGEAATIPGVTLGSCLQLLHECLPSAKYIHIHRDPRDVAYSLWRKTWSKSLEKGVDVWRGHVEETIAFFANLDPSRCHVIAHAALRERPEDAAHGIARFLGLDEPREILEFLISQRSEPTPFSGPMTDLSFQENPEIPFEMRDRLLLLAGPAAAALGYR